MMKLQNLHAVENNAATPDSRNTPYRAHSLTSHPGAEKGVVLFMALIALVALTFAAIALVRSVDTTNLVAGNVALKQGAIQEADAGMNQAFECLDKQGLLLQPGLLAADNATCNYYSWVRPDNNKPFGVPDLLETAPVLSTPAINPYTQNTTQFVIERLCSTTGQWVAATCLDSPWGGVSGAGWHDIRRDIYDGGGSGGQLDAPQALYRISVKVSGPRNLKAYSQVIVNAPR